MAHIYFVRESAMMIWRQCACEMMKGNPGIRHSHSAILMFLAAGSVLMIFLILLHNCVEKNNPSWQTMLREQLGILMSLVICSTSQCSLMINLTTSEMLTIHSSDSVSATVSWQAHAFKSKCYHFRPVSIRSRLVERCEIADHDDSEMR